MNDYANLCRHNFPSVRELRADHTGRFSIKKNMIAIIIGMAIAIFILAYKVGRLEIKTENLEREKTHENDARKN